MVNKSQNLLLVIFIIILGLAGGYIYYSMIGGPAAEIPPLPISEKDNFTTFKNLKLTLSADKDKISQLRVFGENPVKPEAGGRKNPFAPF